MMNFYEDSDCDCNFDCDTCMDDPDECNEQYIPKDGKVEKEKYESNNI